MDFSADAEEESLLFQTLVLSDSIVISNSNSQWSNSLNESDNKGPNLNELFKNAYSFQKILNVKPSRLIFTYINKKKAQTINISNISQSTQIYRIQASHGKTFFIFPEDGSLRPGQDKNIQIELDDSTHDYRTLPKSMQIRVYLENDVIDIPVFIE